MKKIILALDTTNLEESISITKKIKNKIFTIKIGLEFWNAHGKAGIKKFNELGMDNLMLDLKLKDIPETVYKAIRALDNIKFGFLTIHGQGGRSMIESAKKAVNEIESKPKLMMVTILTALTDKDLKDIEVDISHPDYIGTLICVPGHWTAVTTQVSRCKGHGRPFLFIDSTNKHLEKCMNSSELIKFFRNKSLTAPHGGGHSIFINVFI